MAKLYPFRPIVDDVNPAVRPTGRPLRELARLNVDRARRSGQAESTIKSLMRVQTLLDMELSPLPEYPSPDDIVCWLAALRTCGNCARTLDDRRQVLSGWYDYSYSAGWAQGNPADARHPPFKTFKRNAKREKKRAAVVVQDDALARVLEHATDREACALLAVRTLALRPSEMWALRAWGDDPDIRDLVDGRLFVRVSGFRSIAQAKKNHEGKRDVWQRTDYLKNEGDPRVHEVTPELAARLRKLISEGPPTVKIGRGGGERLTVPYLFPASSLSAGMGKRLGELLREAGAPKGRSLYTLRHAWGRAACDAGVPLLEQQAQFGHKNSNTTQGYSERAGWAPTTSLEATSAAAPRRSTKKEGGHRFRVPPSNIFSLSRSRSQRDRIRTLGLSTGKHDVLSLRKSGKTRCELRT